MENKIFDIDTNSKSGQTKCISCGSTDISYDIELGALQCNFCRTKQESEILDIVNADIDKLDGIHVGSGASDIEDGTNTMITLKCQSCAAEVVINIEESTQARCHWCRNTLSINEQVSNGAVPDMILPFIVTMEDGRQEIEKFINSRRFFAHPKFKKEFSTENIFGVYLPYMVIDMKAYAEMSGEGEIETRRYTVTIGSGNNKRTETNYDADVYMVSRQFDININDLNIESNSNKLDKESKSETNNIINAVMPFDVQNSLRWDANFLKGFHSEKRDTNIDELHPIVKKQARDIARFRANETIKQYDRGVCWEQDNIEIRGERWLAVYCPIWLYSYQQIKGSKKLLHYTAVNARTKKTMGSVPINYLKLVIVSLIIGVVCFIASLFFVDYEYGWMLSCAGIIFFAYIYYRYRNTNKRHYYEKDTEAEISNVSGTDVFYKSRKGMRNSEISGKNNDTNID